MKRKAAMMRRMLRRYGLQDRQRAVRLVSFIVVLDQGGTVTRRDAAFRFPTGARRIAQPCISTFATGEDSLHHGVPPRPFRRIDACAAISRPSRTSRLPP